MDDLPSFVKCAKIKVLVLPVGDMDETVFSKYFELISSFNVINLEDLALESMGTRKGNLSLPA